MALTDVGISRVIELGQDIDEYSPRQDGVMLELDLTGNEALPGQETEAQRHNGIDMNAHR